MATDKPTPTKAELEAEIGALRHAVGETVEALSHRLDVKARARERVRSVPTAVPVGVAAVVATGLVIWMWRRRG